MTRHRDRPGGGDRRSVHEIFLTSDCSMFLDRKEKRLAVYMDTRPCATPYSRFICMTCLDRLVEISTIIHIPSRSSDTS